MAVVAQWFETGILIPQPSEASPVSQTSDKSRSAVAVIAFYSHLARGQEETAPPGEANDIGFCLHAAHGAVIQVMYSIHQLHILRNVDYRDFGHHSDTGLSISFTVQGSGTNSPQLALADLFIYSHGGRSQLGSSL